MNKQSPKIDVKRKPYVKPSVEALRIENVVAGSGSKAADFSPPGTKQL